MLNLSYSADFSVILIEKNRIKMMFSEKRRNFALGLRKDAGVVDRDGLENRCTGNRTEGSNPSLSANKGVNQ